MSWNAPIVRGAKPAKPRQIASIDGKPTFESAVETWLSEHVTAKGRRYATTTQDVVRFNLLGARLSGWRKQHGIRTVDAWNAEAATDFLRWYQTEIKADADTVRKFRTQLRQFGRFCARKYGLEDAIGPALDSLRIAEGPSDPKEKTPALTQGEAKRLLKEAPTQRDALIVALLLYTGMRPSELVALKERHIRLDHTPPVVVIEGSIHDPNRAKTEAGHRTIPLTIGGQTILARLMKAHLMEPGRPRGAEYVFLSRKHDSLGNPLPLSIGGLDLTLARLEKQTGIKCNAYRFRHTFCTWCADAAMPMLFLQQLLGHQSADMVAYYYRGKTSQAVLEAAARTRF